MRINPQRSRARLRLRTILLTVNLTVLILPLAGAFFFRFYENELVRQTEQELIAQSAIVAALYTHSLTPLLSDPVHYGAPLPDYRPPAANDPFTPIPAQLDLTGAILPQRPDAVPVPPSNDRAERTASAAIDPVLLDAQKTTLAGIRILDSRGVVVSGPKDTGLSFANLPEMREALAGHYKSVIRERISKHAPPALASISRGTGIRVFAAYPVIENGRLWGVIYASRTPKNILEYLYNERQKVALAGSILLALALLLALLTSYTISQPIYRLIERTRRVAGGDKDAMKPIEHPVTKEVELLSESFAAMAQALHERSDYMRTFATHVSHEFKTPLSSIRGAAELLQDYDDIEPAKQSHFLSLILQDTDRLTRLVSRLLELARADALLPIGEACDVTKILAGMKGRFAETGLALLFEDKTVPAAMSCENLEIVFSNLFDNARRHGATKVTIGITTKDGFLHITVTDDGEGVSTANAERIFTPFFTTRRDDGGTGLGLDIVRSILERHGGSIRLSSALLGACFILQIPLT